MANVHIIKPRPGVQFTLMEALFKERGYDLVNDPGYADILVFGPGTDVNPSIYGQTKHPKTVSDDSRDRRDLAMFLLNRTAFKVGVGRGAQLLNVLAGGSMIQHMSNQHHYRSHAIYLPSGSENRILNGCTSCHHQLMVPSPAEDTEILGLAWDTNKTHNKFSLGEPLDSHEFPPEWKIMDIDRFYDKYYTPRFNPEDDEAEVLYYPLEGSLCFQPRPDFSNAPKYMVDWFFELIEKKRGNYSLLKHSKNTEVA